MVLVSNISWMLTDHNNRTTHHTNAEYDDTAPHRIHNMMTGDSHTGLIYGCVCMHMVAAWSLLLRYCIMGMTTGSIIGILYWDYTTVNIIGLILLCQQMSSSGIAAVGSCDDALFYCCVLPHYCVVVLLASLLLFSVAAVWRWMGRLCCL